jgi:ADP-ribose pyrophosphatase YjhB (NUDIX family)
MRERPTVRVLLIGPDQRILLVRFLDPRLNRGKVFWATVGGALDPDETVEAGARRETLEETGLTDIELGPVVWTDDPIIKVGDEKVQFRETYIVARTKGGALSHDGFTAEEKDAITELRWWTVDDIRAAEEQVYPEILADWLPDILAARYPSMPRKVPRQQRLC